jgi:hypothetical protein
MVPVASRNACYCLGREHVGRVGGELIWHSYYFIVTVKQLNKLKKGNYMKRQYEHSLSNILFSTYQNVRK